MLNDNGNSSSSIVTRSRLHKPVELKAANLIGPPWRTFGNECPSTQFLPNRHRLGVTACSAVTLGSTVYQFSETATKLSIKNLFNAVITHGFIVHQLIKLVFE
jgi:hypothetical protein